MRIATWNVASIRARAALVVDFLLREDIDVLALQETKCRPEQFPTAIFEAAGYQVVNHGFHSFNGVAFVSRHDMTDVTFGLASLPGFGEQYLPTQPPGANGLPQEARALGVTVNGMRLWSLYVPNGRDLAHEHYAYKLHWLQALQQEVAGWLEAEPQLPLALLGDWNVAPLPSDMGDPDFVEGRSTHVSRPERQAFAAFESYLSDVVRPYAPHGYTFWEYRGGKYQADQGMRIDFILGSEGFSSAVTGAFIAADERRERLAAPGQKAQKPSDHVPVVCEIAPELLGQSWEDEDDPMIWGL